MKVKTPKVTAFIGNARITVEPIPRRRKPCPSSFRLSYKENSSWKVVGWLKALAWRQCKGPLYFCKPPKLSAWSRDLMTSCGYVNTHERTPAIPPPKRTEGVLSPNFLIDNNQVAGFLLALTSRSLHRSWSRQQRQALPGSQWSQVLWKGLQSQHFGWYVPPFRECRSVHTPTQILKDAIGWLWLNCFSQKLPASVFSPIPLETQLMSGGKNEI